MAAVGLKVIAGALFLIVVMALSWVVVLDKHAPPPTQWTFKPSQPPSTHFISGSVESKFAPPGNSADLRGHVFVIRYSDQLSQAVKNFFQLSYIAAGWNLKVVEPFLRSKSSGLVGMPHDKSLPFFGIYSETAVHKEMEECFGIGELNVIESFQDFLVNASRQVIVVKFLKSEIKNEENVSAVFQCSVSQQTVEQQLNHYLDQNIPLKRRARAAHGGKYHFNGIQSICVNGWNFSVEGVHAHILSTARGLQYSQRGAVTVVIPEWTRVTDRYPVPFYYSDTKCSWKMCRTEGLPFGDRILGATEVFMYALNIHQPVLGIHIRIERLVQSELQQGLSGSYKQMCLKTFEAVIRALQRKYKLKTNNIVAMHDLGKFGSRTCHHPLCVRIKDKVLKILSKLGVRVVNYDPARFNEVNDVSFNSLVDMAFLTRADYLLTLAWGGYHRKLMKLFEATHNDSVSFSVCSLGPNNTGHHLPGLDLKLL